MSDIVFIGGNGSWNVAVDDTPHATLGHFVLIRERIVQDTSWLAMPVWSKAGQ